MKAIKNNNNQFVINQLTTKYKDMYSMDHRYDQLVVGLLSVIVKNNNISLVKSLLSHIDSGNDNNKYIFDWNKLINKRHYNLNTLSLLHYCSIYGSDDLVHYLFECNDSESTQFITKIDLLETVNDCLFCDSQSIDVKLAGIIAKKDNNVINQLLANGLTLLHESIWNKNQNAFDWLLDNNSTTINVSIEVNSNSDEKSNDENDDNNVKSRQTPFIMSHTINNETFDNYFSNKLLNIFMCDMLNNVTIDSLVDFAYFGDIDLFRKQLLQLLKYKYSINPLQSKWNDLDSVLKDDHINAWIKHAESNQNETIVGFLNDLKNKAIKKKSMNLLFAMLGNDSSSDSNGTIDDNERESILKLLNIYTIS